MVATRDGKPARLLRDVSRNPLPGKATANCGQAAAMEVRGDAILTYNWRLEPVDRHNPPHPAQKFLVSGLIGEPSAHPSLCAGLPGSSPRSGEEPCSGGHALGAALSSRTPVPAMRTSQAGRHQRRVGGHRPGFFDRRAQHGEGCLTPPGWLQVNQGELRLHVGYFKTEMAPSQIFEVQLAA